MPALRKKLGAARDAWVTDFWKNSGLVKPTAKSGTTLTPEQADEIRQAVLNLNGDQYSSVLYDELAASVVAGYTSAYELLELSIDFSEDSVPAYAMEALRTHVDQFAFLVNNREQTYLNGLIDTALAQGWTPGELATNIGVAFEEGYHIFDDRELQRVIPEDSWASTVARTELSRAQSLGAVALYKDAGIQRVMWVSTQGANCCDECSEADGTVEDLGSDFEGVDVDSPPAHPNCCCVLVAADADVNPEAAAENEDA